VILLLGLVFFLSVVWPAAAGADVQTVTFDLGPPAGPALGTPVERLDEAGDILFTHGPGFRPYRTDVGERAHSGSTVGDVGRCIDEVEEADECELFHASTDVQLTRSAETVTVFAGRFGPVDPTATAEGAILTAFNADGEELAATGPVPIDDSGFDTRLSVSNAAGEIAGFTIAATKLGPPGSANDAGDLGIDDLSVAFADHSPADFSVSTTNQVVRVPQGLHVDVPVQLPRLNGSNGPIRLSASGLPRGVSATFVPEDPVLGTDATATLRLNASPSAPADFTPSEVTITADPQGNPSVGPGPRTATLSVRVATNFELSVNGLSEASLPPEGKVPIEVPDCAPVDLPLEVSRDIAFDRDISLSLREDRPQAVGLPPGVSAEILPSAVVSAGGDLGADRILRFRADASSFPGGEEHPAPILLEARSGALSRTLPMTMVPAKPEATIAPTVPWSESPLGHTPRLGGTGTRVQIHGTGFCPGTTVNVGHDFNRTPTTFVDDHTIEFNLPRYATSGPITVIPPGSRSAYSTDNSLTVDSVRNSDGFQFKNYPFGSLSFGELTRAFGADDVFIHVNPCWPFGDCTVSTGIPNQLALVDWGALDLAMRYTDGHCFGMSLAIQDLRSGKESYRQFLPAGSKAKPADAYELPGPNGPNDSLGSFLDAEHAKQGSDEFLTAFFNRSKSLQAQLDTIEREFSRGREPIISIRHGRFGGHALLAYDMTQTADKAEIYVYDTRRRFQPEEDFSSSQHHDEIDFSTIHVDKIGKTWKYQMGTGDEWAGGEDGTLWAVPQGSVPDDPSLPGLGALKAGWEVLMGGSSDGSLRPLDGSAGAEYLPVLNGGPAAAGSGGTWVAPSGGQPLDVAFEGVRPGHYTEAYSSPGFAAGVGDVETDRGVRDTLRGGGDALTLDSGEARPLRIELARAPSPAMSASATLDTHASAGGSDTAGFSDAGTLSYAHDGAPTTVSFRLSTVRREGGPATFVSGPVAVGRGDRLSVRPVDRDLRLVRVSIRDAHGRTTSRLLRNRSRSHLHLALGRPKVAGRRISLRFELSGLRRRAVAGVALRLMRGGHLVAHKAIPLRLADGTHRISWRLPRAAGRGRYRLLTDVRAMATGPGAAASGSVSAHRAARVQIKR
jgi:hypothetical protein